MATRAGIICFTTMFIGLFIGRAMGSAIDITGIWLVGDTLRELGLTILAEANAEPSARPGQDGYEVQYLLSKVFGSDPSGAILAIPGMLIGFLLGAQLWLNFEDRKDRNKQNDSRPE